MAFKFLLLPLQIFLPRQALLLERRMLFLTTALATTNTAS
jgi:hypothetical protein